MLDARQAELIAAMRDAIIERFSLEIAVGVRPRAIRFERGIDVLGQEINMQALIGDIYAKADELLQSTVKVAEYVEVEDE